MGRERGGPGEMDTPRFRAPDAARFKDQGYGKAARGPSAAWRKCASTRCT